MSALNLLLKESETKTSYIDYLVASPEKGGDVIPYKAPAHTSGQLEPQPNDGGGAVPPIKNKGTVPPPPGGGNNFEHGGKGGALVPVGQKGGALTSVKQKGGALTSVKQKGGALAKITKNEEITPAEKSFFNKHWGKMAMGAGVAGAGAYLYEKNKKKNEER